MVCCDVMLLGVVWFGVVLCGVMWCALSRQASHSKNLHYQLRIFEIGHVWYRLKAESVYYTNMVLFLGSALKPAKYRTVN